MTQQSQLQQTRLFNNPSQIISITEGALASSGALIFSNPFELVKTRMQLQGELQSKAATRVVYRGMLHAVYRVAATEGPLALYQGLGAAGVHQLIMNGLRVGGYAGCRDEFVKVIGPGFSTNVLAAASIGIVSSFVSSPFFMLKTRMQAANVAAAVATEDKLGSQYRYRSMPDAFAQIYKKDGARGFFKGAVSAMVRTAVGSAAQLPVYDAVKDVGMRSFGFDAHDVRLHVLCAVAAATSITVWMTPADTINVRMYSGKHAYSGGVIGAFQQVVKAEGVLALWKGYLPLWWRTAPHSTATFVFLEFLRKHRAESSGRVAPFLYGPDVRV